MANRRIVSKIRSRISLPLIDRSESTSTLFVAGTGRSGTTWVAELLNHNNDFRLVFEPFHPIRSHKRLRTKGRAFSYPGGESSYSSQVECVLDGSFRSLWTDQYNSGFVYNKKLIKAIRVNLLLPWIQARYSDLPIIFVVRNPVLNSVSRLKGNWPAPLEYFDNMEVRSLHPAIDYYVKHRGNLSEWQATVVFWCIENLIALAGIKDRGHVVSHEELIVSPGPTIKSLFEFASVPIGEDIDMKYSQPSTMARKGSVLSTSESSIRQRLDSVELDLRKKSDEILKKFELDGIYGSSGLPVVSAVDFGSRIPEVRLWK